MNKHSGLFDLFAVAPESQVDKELALEIAALSKLSDEELKPEIIKDILDRIVYGALASDFVVATLDIVWRGLCDENISTDTRTTAA